MGSCCGTELAESDGSTLSEDCDIMSPKYQRSIDTGLQFLEDCEELVNDSVYDTLMDLVDYLCEPLSRSYAALQSEDHLDLFEKFWYGLTENFGSKFPDCRRNPWPKKVLRYVLNPQWRNDEETQVAYICLLFLCYFLVLTDVSDKVCREFGQRNYLATLLRGLQTEILPKTFEELMTGIIYNCCRKIPENRILCKDGIATLEDLSESPITEIRSVALLSLAYIIDKSDVKKISLNKSCTKYLLHALKKTFKDHPDRCGDDYTVEELLQGLYQLAMNDNNKRLIAEHGGITLMERVLTSDDGTNKEKCFAAQGIWQLAFIDKNKLKIRRRQQLMKGKSLYFTSFRC